MLIELHILLLLPSSVPGTSFAATILVTVQPLFRNRLQP